MSSRSTQRKRFKSKKRSPSPSIPFLKEPSSTLFPSKQDLLKLLAVVSIAASVAFACNYTVQLFNRKPKPFCDTNDSSQDSLSGFCEPCPDYGECSESKWECLPGYKKHGRLCVEDGEINQTAKKLKEWVEHYVCEAYAQLLCDGTGTIWFREEEILKEIDEHNMKDNFGLKDTFFYMKQKAIEIIESSLDIRTNSNGVKELKCPDRLAEQYRPLLCCIRQWAYKNAIFILPFTVLLIGLMKILWRARQSRYLSSRAEELYELVCDILEENAMTAKTMKGEVEPWVVSSRLRDHLLLPKERKNPVLWKKVEELVQEDSRIDQYPKLIKGESKTVWEWQVEGSLSSRRKGKGVVSKVKSQECMNESSAPQQRKLQLGELLHC